jgi:hypothetical protein
MHRILFILLISISLQSFAVEYKNDEDTSEFSGRISRINTDAKLVRIKIKFENGKFLRKKDRIEFWNETYPDKKCLSYLEGRTSEYILVRVPQYDLCIRKVHASVGSFLHLYSPDLENAIGIAKDLVSVLKKKQLALEARMNRYKKSVNSFVEKMDVVNKRYEVLRQKLEIEWQSELSSLEEDKTQSYMTYKHTQSRLNELEHKLQQYRVHDQNLTEDRWSLDPKLYFKK